MTFEDESIDVVTMGWVEGKGVQIHAMRARSRRYCPAEKGMSDLKTAQTTYLRNGSRYAKPHYHGSQHL